MKIEGYQEILEKQSDVLAALCMDYVAVYHADLKTGEYQVYKIADRMRQAVEKIVRKSLDYDIAMEQYIEKYVIQEDQEYLRRRVNRTYVLERLKTRKDFFVRYRVKPNPEGMEHFEIHFVNARMIRTDLTSDAECPYVVVGFRNVDDAFHREETTRMEAQREIEEILEGARTGLWTIEVEEGCLPRMYADRTMCRLLGVAPTISPEECYRRWYANIYDDYKEIVEECVDAILETSRSEVIYPWNHPERGMIYVRCGGIFDPGYSKTGYRLRGYHQDITDTMMTRREQDKKLMEALVEARRANAVKSQFLSHMSHDIRTPINGILGMLSIIERSLNDPERRRECRQKIRMAAEHLLSLINDVLDISKLESGHQEIASEPFDLCELIESCIEMIRPQAESQSIRIEDTYMDLRHRTYIGSPLHLRQILMNILSNSVKYNRPGGRIRVLVEELSSDDTAAFGRLTVEDTGIGMSEEFQKHLFEPFTQEHMDARTDYKGTGLGMAITKGLVELMGGTITVKSCPGKGSTFEVRMTMPIAEDAAPDREEETEEIPDLSGLKVLLAEDNELNREIVEYMLYDAGVEVFNACNGEKAVQLFERTYPWELDCILMDVMMPVMDGLEAARQIRSMDREDAAHIPIIALTANAFVEDVKETREAGMDEHITKPLDMDRLFRILATYTKRK